MIDRPKGWGSENPVTHRKTTAVSADWVRRPNGDRNMRTDTSSSAPQYIISNPLGFYDIVPRGSHASMYSDLPFPDHGPAALKAMWPEVEADISLINFIYELKDLRTIPKTLKSLRDLVGLLGSRGKSSSPIKDISDVYLQNEFGIQPLVRDVQSISKAVQEFSTKFRDYFLKQDTILRRHYTQWYYPSSVPWTNTSGQSPFGSPRHWAMTTNAGIPQVRYQATLAYSYSLPGLGPDDEHARRLFALDLYGIQWNPKIVWDAVPYSFLLDYVLKVGTWLEQFKLRNIEPNVVIWDFVESIKYRATRQHWVIPFGNNANGSCWCGDMHQDVYIRRMKVPNVYTTLQTSGLTTRQIINMAALGGSRTRRK